MMFEYGNNWPLWQGALMWVGMIGEDDRVPVST